MSKEQYIVVSDRPIWVRKEPSISSKTVGLIYPNEMIVVEAKNNNFLKTSKGWVAEYTANGTQRLVEKYDSVNDIALMSADYSSGKYLEEESNVTDSRGPNIKTDTRAKKDEIIPGSALYNAYIINSGSTEKNQINSDYKASYVQSLGSINIETLRGIYGMPYQWMPHVDPRLANSTIGRVYGDRIVAKMPLLIIAPGEPDFLAGYSDKSKEDVLSNLLKKDKESEYQQKGGSSDLDRILKSEGKYYSFRYAGNSYYQFLNPMLRTAAMLLGIGDREYNGNKLSQYHWGNNYNPGVYRYWTGRNAMAFYINSETSISDNFGNDDTQSALASKVNGFSDMAKEAQFLVGGSSAATGIHVDNFVSTKALLDNDMNIADSTSAMVSNTGALGQFLKQITGGFQTVLAGGKLIFPNIWSDSSFSRSYSVSFKFVSPDYDVYSWYMNVLVPICHLICMTAPRQSGPNGYLTPFLVRAFYKGLFNCDMGLITSLNINKGTEGGWTRNGLPTVVDVSMDIKDLYSNISITRTVNNTRNILTNSIFMDYLANLCGININEPDLNRTAELYYKTLIRAPIADIHDDIMGALQATFDNMILNSYGRALYNR